MDFPFKNCAIKMMNTIIHFSLIIRYTYYYFATQGRRNEVESGVTQGKRGTFSEERGTFDHAVAYNEREKKLRGGCAEMLLV